MYKSGNEITCVTFNAQNQTVNRQPSTANRQPPTVIRLPSSKTVYLYNSSNINGSKKNYDPYPAEYEVKRGTDFHDHSL
jgi:hypothetical protein